MSSILRKQIVALTGIALIGFVIVHMSGNLLIFFGPEAFNHYSEKLREMGAALWAARAVLLVAFIVHIWLTVSIVLHNRSARGSRYEVKSHKRDDAGFARKTMIYTGLIVLVFVVLHLMDFTFPLKEGPRTMIPGIDDENLQLYGLVWASFLKPWRAILYILAMILVGLHLSHGLQSLVQTLGFRHEKYTPMIQKASIALGIIIAVGFSMVPIYINIVRTPNL
jgi:succinate dehydrogenase / fumarate reductase cytochrome b subunit